MSEPVDAAPSMLDSLLARAGATSEARLQTALLVALLVAAAWLRFDAVAQGLGPERYQGGDVAKYYVGTAQNFLAGRGWTPRLDYNYIPPPLQSLFMVAVWKLAPAADFDDLRRLQAGLGVATVGFAFALGSLLWNRWCGLGCAALLALDPKVIGYSASLLTESNYFFLLFAFLWLLVLAVQKSSVRWMAAAGLALGFTALVKSFPMLLAGWIPAVLLLRDRRRDTLWMCAVFVAAFLLVVTPWLVRNTLRYGHAYSISTNSGTLLAQSNFATLDSADPNMRYWESIYRTPWWQSPEIETRFEGAVDADGRAEWNEKDRAYARHALAYIASHPLHFARNYLVKLGNALVHPLGRPSTGISSLDVLRLTLTALGLGGLLAYGWTERDRAAWILVPVVLYYGAFTALFHITRSGRINFPLKVLLSLFAAFALTRMIEMAFEPSREPEEAA